MSDVPFTILSQDVGSTLGARVNDAVESLHGRIKLKPGDVGRRFRLILDPSMPPDEFEIRTSRERVRVVNVSTQHPDECEDTLRAVLAWEDGEEHGHLPDELYRRIEAALSAPAGKDRSDKIEKMARIALDEHPEPCTWCGVEWYRSWEPCDHENGCIGVMLNDALLVSWESVFPSAPAGDATCTGCGRPLVDGSCPRDCPAGTVTKEADGEVEPQGE